MPGGPLYPLVEEGQTVEGPLIGHGCEEAITTDKGQMLLVVNGPLLAVRLTLTVKELPLAASTVTLEFVVGPRSEPLPVMLQEYLRFGPNDSAW